eukprot:TRINITY_DN8519_c0_g2_i3.p1 TRINITY_DN8519_c0_g2~~TRINITY_DN8519_c0_g2_i3.p1  ORF type:complete len:234 (-),score=28.93 TRINITY_DN8519_c0_g2_i3:272-973(-)
MFDNAEFWMGASGTGARAHMDSHCISTLSVVLSGARRWRIGPPPRVPKGGGRSRPEEVVFDDGVAYGLGWEPLYEFTVHQGEGVLFPPGWIHETYNIAQGCTSALTTQLRYPAPAGYFREFYSRSRRIGDLAPCWDNMIHWGQAGSDLKQADTNGDGLVDAVEGHQVGLDPVFDFYDQTGSRSIKLDGIKDLLAQWGATERALSREQYTDPDRIKFDVSLSAETKDGPPRPEL